MEFYRAELPYYTCGFWVDDDKVIIDAAPIMYWAIGRKLESFMKWAQTRKGKVQLIGEEGRPYTLPGGKVVLARQRGSNVGEPPLGGGKPSEVVFEL